MKASELASGAGVLTADLEGAAAGGAFDLRDMAVLSAPPGRAPAHDQVAGLIYRRPLVDIATRRAVSKC